MDNRARVRADEAQRVYREAGQDQYTDAEYTGISRFHQTKDNSQRGFSV